MNIRRLVLTTSLMFACVGFAHAELEPPTLLKPDNEAKLRLKKVASFTWGKVTGATKYRIIFSNDENFANYDANKFKCLDKTCFTSIVASTSYKLAASNAILKTDGDYFWQVQAVNKQEISEIVTTATTNGGEVRVFKITDYSKISNDGSPIPDSAILGEEPTDWACTKDNKTGLIWEIKTTDGGLRDIEHYYANYDKIYPKCDETGRGISNVGYCDYYKLSKLGESTNTDGFVKAVNKQSLCGANDWRIPTRDELNGLIYCSDGKYKKLNDANLIHGSGFVCASNIGLRSRSEITIKSPTINTTYFPDITENSGFWSSSSNVHASKHAWIVFFDDGNDYSDDKDSDWYRVRLVRNAK